ncbi:transposable element Tcb1 transposase [Trichonephila clavipes]|nr:transposable element Tcb1 transposase [Trichonephila clavipes]
MPQQSRRWAGEAGREQGQHIEWRKEFHIDTILTDFKPLEVFKYAASSFVCFDKEGHLIRYFDFGNADFKGLFNSAKKLDVLQYCLLTMEQDLVLMKKQGEKLGKPVMQAIHVVNFENLTFSQATNRTALETGMLYMKAFQDNYPERVKYTYHINASYYYTLTMSVVKTVIASAVFQKFKVFGTAFQCNNRIVMAQRKHLDDFLRGRIIGRLECGRTQLEVSEELGIAQSVISRLWQRFQDDGNVSRCYSTGRPRVTTPNEDRYLAVIAKRNRRSTASDMSRQLSSATGTTVSRTDLHVQSVTLTGHIYRDVILEQHARLFRGALGAEFLFMDDNTRPHRANIVDKCIQSQDIILMDWPAYSPDLNPIEHVWDMLGRRVAARQPPPTCLPELRRALLDEWCNILQDQIDNLILSMPGHCKACIASSGRHTPY